jgi:putative aldouronate transport system substrate-binding protein
MKKFTRILASVIVASMAVSFTACKKSDNDTKTPTPTQTTSPNAEVERDPETGLPMLANRNKPITFKYFIRDPGTVPSKDNPVLKKITELTGVTVEFEFLVGDLAQKVGVMIAGEDYPDVIFGEPQKFLDAGALIPLEDKLFNYPNLSKQYSPYKDVMTNKDGSMYLLEVYMSPKPAPTFAHTGAGFFIQKAVLEEFGYKIPKTVDEYFKLIEDYKAKYPTIDGVKTIGFEILSDGWRDFCLRNPAQHLLGDGNNGDATVDYATNEPYFYQITDTAKNYYKKLNEQYHKGNIEGETFTQSYDQYISRLSTGAVLGMFDQQWNFGNGETVLKKDGKWNRTYVAVPLTNPGVKDGYIDAKDGSITGTSGIGITKKCKDPDRLLEFFDWLLNQEVQDYLQWGVEGKDWTKAGDNDKVLTKERRELNKDTAKQRDMTGVTLWNYSIKRQGLWDDGSPCGPGDSTAEYLAGQEEYDKNFLKALNISYPAQILSEPTQRPTKYYPIWALPIEDGSPAKVANTAFNDVTRKYYPQLIMADPSKFDSMWDEFVKAFNASNPQPYLDEVNKLIKERLAR